MTITFVAVAILGLIGLALGAVIALANRTLKVWEDPRIEVVTGMLPGANCGACGVPGCRAFAELAVAGKKKPGDCNVINAPGAASIAQYLGVDAGGSVKRVARLLCAGGTNVSTQRATYAGLESCAAASTVSGGGKGCAWGCLGFGDCGVACSFDAIHMTSYGLPLVDVAKCTACGDCVDACPKGLFTIMTLDQRLIVQCRSALEGDAVLASCSVGCTACGKCALDGAPGLIAIRGGLAVVDYDRNELADPSAIRRCPTGAIVWVDGAQRLDIAPVAAQVAEVA
jgi:Na+-translocating ferredoxin:NAD+ oxidoreductase RNF subunit RnfB